jgi:HEAT repeat protein
MLNEAFQELQKYDWGTDLALLAPIDDAIAASHGKEADRKELEIQLLKSLERDISRDAKDYVCRKLGVVGSSESVPALRKLLTQENHSHMARFALERIPGFEAKRALVEALATVGDALKVGIIGSIGSRRDVSSIPVLASFLKNANAAVVKAAAVALGTIGTSEAAAALGNAKPSSEIFDAQLMCAESLLANNQVEDAKKIYSALALDDRERIVRLAATRGLLACTAKGSS